MMNKKIIMLAGIFFCGSFGGMVAAEAPGPLTVQENTVYQGLVDKFNKSELSKTDNTQYNISILDKQEKFLKMQATKKELLWPQVLAASVGPSFLMSSLMVSSLAPGLNYDSYIVKFFQLPYVFNRILGLPSYSVPRFFYNIVPAIAFYSMYKKYSSLKSQQQELEMAREIQAVLNGFGQSS